MNSPATNTDTIYALATPPGRSGVAVIRLSGARALAAWQALTRKADAELNPRQATLCTLFHPRSQEPIDTALALYFKGPESFTGEDVVELQTHGSLAVLKDLLAVLGAMDGLRMAEAGEFARRAFWNGKLDLTAAEGLADLIDAETSAQRRQAMQIAQGDVKRAYDDLRQQMLKSLAYLEAYIDFPEEDLPPTLQSAVREEMDRVIHQLSHILDDAAKHEKIREGLSCVILGAPNVGKSSLINALSQREVAIVSEVEGTTRDKLEAPMVMAGLPVTLVDTAGIRQSEDSIEQEGVKRALSAVAEADIALYVMDASAPKWDKDLWEKTPKHAIRLLVWNKMDVAGTQPDLAHESLFDAVVGISANVPGGISPLEVLLSQQISKNFGTEQLPMVTRARHRELLSEALRQMGWAREVPISDIEIACEYLRQAALSIGKMTGIIAPDEVLGHIFGSFCIGK